MDDMKDKKDAMPYQPNMPAKPAPPPTHGQCSGRLLGESGPVKLGSSKKGILTLGAIRPAPAAKPVEMKPPAHQVSEPIHQPDYPADPVTESYKPADQPPIYETAAPAQSPYPETQSVPAVLRGLYMPDRSRPSASASTSWSPGKWEPKIDRTSFVHPTAIIIGNVHIDGEVFVGPGVMIRGDNEEPIHIATTSYLQ